MNMTDGVNGNLTLFQKFDQFQADEAKQQADEKKAQQAEQMKQQSIYNWTGINTKNFGENSSIFDNAVGVGQCALSPVTTTLNVGGSVLGGVLGGVGNLLSPVLGLVGSLFGGAGQGVQGQQGGQRPAPGQPGQPGQTNPSTDDGMRSLISKIGTGSNSGSSSTDSTGSTGSTSGSDSTSSTTKSGSSNKSTSNSALRSAQQYKDIKTGETTSQTKGYELTSTYVGAMAEEHYEATQDVKTLETQVKSAEKKVADLKAKAGDKKVNEKTQAEADVKKWDGAISNYTTKHNKLQADIKAQKDLLNNPDYADRKDEINQTIEKLEAEATALYDKIVDAEAQKKIAQEKATNCKDQETQDSTLQQLANAEAELKTLNHQLTEAREREATTKANQDEAVSYAEEHKPTGTDEEIKEAEGKSFKSVRSANEFLDKSEAKHLSKGGISTTDLDNALADDSSEFSTAVNARMAELKNASATPEAPADVPPEADNPPADTSSTETGSANSPSDEIDPESETGMGIDQDGDGTIDGVPVDEFYGKK